MRNTAILLALTFAACASPSPQDAETPFATALIGRAETASSGGGPAPVTHSIPAPPARPASDEWRGILPPEGLEALRSVAADDAALSRFLERPLDADSLAGLAYLRSPAIRAARGRYEAARAGYSLSTELADLASLYRSFSRESGGGMPYLGLSSLSGEVVHRTVEMAFEDLRAAVRDTTAASMEVHADAARLTAARRIVEEELDLERDLLEVLEARLEAGEESQAALLAFQASVKKLETELRILEETEAVIRARVNRLLDRPPGAAIGAVESVAPRVSPGIDFQGPAALASSERQELRKAGFAVERASAALRIAETMSLPHARFPATEPQTGARPDFGVREGQVARMRAKRAALEAARAETANRVATEVREAAFGVDAAVRRLILFRSEVVPLSEKAVSAVRGAYEGNRAGYLDLLDATRRLLDARLSLVDATRNLARARATLLRVVGARED